jgi:hypothetical protein
MSCCAAPRVSSARRRAGGSTGAALVAALAAMLLLSVLGMGLVLTSSLEPAIAESYEASWGARYAAEAGLAIAAHELGAQRDWSLALTGQARSALLEPAGTGVVDLPDGTRVDLQALTNVARCGHAGRCTDAELNAFTADRPWGPNNPRWQVFGVTSLGRHLPDAPAGRPFVVVVWVADDPADTDGDPLRDSPAGEDGGRRPGAGLIQLRAEAFGVRSAHRTITATLARPRGGSEANPRIVAWRE